MNQYFTLTLPPKVSTSSIYRALTKGLGYSRKVIYEKATQQVMKDKNHFIATLRFYSKNPEMAILVDESNKSRSAARRKYGWSRIGTPVSYRSTLFNMNIRYFLIGVADCFGFVIPACDIVLHQYTEKEENKPKIKQSELF